MVDVLFCDGDWRFGRSTSWFFYEWEGYSWMIEIENHGGRLREYGSCFQVVKWKEGANVRAFADSVIADAPSLIGYGAPTRQLIDVAVEPGTYYPRIWRPGIDHMPLETDDNLTTHAQSMVAARLLWERLVEIFGTVEPSRENLSTYGHRIRDVLVLACMEVESAWAGVLHANGYERDRMNTNDYVKLRDPMRLQDFAIPSLEYPGIMPFRPFAGWKDANPTDSLPWYAAYNATKHNRERSFREATLEHAIHAVGAVLVMVHAQFGPSRITESCFMTMEDRRPERFYIPLVDPRLNEDGKLVDGGFTKQFVADEYHFSSSHL